MPALHAAAIPSRLCRREAPLTKPAPAARSRLLSPVSSWYVTDILCRRAAAGERKAGPIAYKTGTSYGFRDAWAVGFDGAPRRRRLGRPAGRCLYAGLTGRAAAAPLLFDAFARIPRVARRFRGAPSGALELPVPTCRRRSSASARPGDDDGAAGAYLEPAVQISFPPDRSELEVEGGESTGVVVKAEGGVLPLTWLVDGADRADPQRRDVELPAGGRGFFKLAVIDASGRADRVTHQAEVTPSSPRIPAKA